MANRLNRDSERIAQAKAWVLETAIQSDEQIAEILSTERAAYESVFSRLSQAQADFSPGEEEWCISQISRHMTHTQEAIGGLIPLLAGGTVYLGGARLLRVHELQDLLKGVGVKGRF